MAFKLTNSPSPVSQFWISSLQLSGLQKICLVLVGTLILTLSAKIAVPVCPINSTMQSFAVIAIGATYGRKLAVATIALYLFEGALGFPVFTGTPERGIGLICMAGPTAGFLLGFIAAAYVSGVLVERGWGKSLKSAYIAYLSADVALYIPGMLWFVYLMGTDIALKNFLIWVPSLIAKQFLGTALLRLVAPFLQSRKK